ncbi:winged helix-turn-helix domain-containing protein [Streptomyces africanus]|uniref:winged helix-turn-helix domain-containing protein n=1 Tax=Streptomyces africanus TaxID=231024 RepID=UPI000A3B1404|nr:winged helix-turn-helix domain-containing protein [Streptomyces africanus]
MDEVSRRESASPELDRVLRILLDRIAGGTFPPGSLLPTQREMVREFDVSRDTVQRALRRLADEGYIQSRQGSGTRVLRSPLGDERPAGPGLLHASLGRLVQDAFSAQVVTIDVFSLTGESLDMHLRLSAERILDGQIRPESISVRLLLAQADGDHPLFRVVGEPEDRRAIDRLQRTAAMHTTSIRDFLSHLQWDGLVPNVRFELAQTSVAPLQKLYLLNATDVVTDYYQVVRRRVVLDTADEVEVHDIVELGAPLHHHSVAGMDPDPESVAIVNSAKRWYEHAWANAARSETG